MALKIGSTSVSKMYKGSIEVTKGYLGSSLIYSSAAPSTALTDSNFYTAVNLWFTNQAQAEATYGLIGDWNTTAVTNMQNAFKVAGVVTNNFNEDISSWDVSNVTSIKRMFVSQNLFNQDISGWDVSNVTHFGQTFNYSIAFNQDISGWDVGSSTIFYRMFLGASSFNQNLGSWALGDTVNMQLMFLNTALSTINYDPMLIGWEATLQTQFPNGAGYLGGVGISFGSAKYTSGSASETARASLISNFSWTITDGGIV